MLDLAVDYIKELKDQVEVRIAWCATRCTFQKSFAR